MRAELIACGRKSEVIGISSIQGLDALPLQSPAPLRYRGATPIYSYPGLSMTGETEDGKGGDVAWIPLREQSWWTVTQHARLPDEGPWAYFESRLFGQWEAQGQGYDCDEDACLWLSLRWLVGQSLFAGISPDVG